MTTHLNDEQFAQWLEGSAGHEAKAHVERCDACAGELGVMRAALAELPEQTHNAAQQNDAFWRAQRLAISARIRRAPGPRAALHWSLAFAALLLFAVLMNRPYSMGQTAVTEAVATDPDHELLLQIEQTVNRRVPAALAPADLLVSELNSAVKQELNP